MKMAPKIDVERFLCFLLGLNDPKLSFKGGLKAALRDQNLEYKDGRIVTIEQ